jgi:hypothetical protein
MNMSTHKPLWNATTAHLSWRSDANATARRFYKMEYLVLLSVTYVSHLSLQD